MSRYKIGRIVFERDKNDREKSMKDSFGLYLALIRIRNQNMRLENGNTKSL